LSGGGAGAGVGAGAGGLLVSVLMMVLTHCFAGWQKAQVGVASFGSNRGGTRPRQTTVEQEKTRL
jgi:hypothetical protein